MRQLGKVCLSGFVGGSLCGFLIQILNAAFDRTINAESLMSSAIVAITLGGTFGIVAFSACYYLFLANLPLRTSLLVTIPATVIVALLFEVLPIYSSNITYSGWSWNLLVRLYGPPLLGLILASIALNRFAPTKAIRSGRMHGQH
jgi:hypothetical protein